MSQYFVNMNTEVSKEWSHLNFLNRFESFQTSPDKKHQIELTIDEPNVLRSNKCSIKWGVANTTNYAFLIEREDKAYSSGKKMQVACHDIDVFFNEEEKKIYICHRDLDKQASEIIVPYLLPKQFSPHAHKNQKQEFEQFLKTCAIKTNRPAENKSFTNYEAKMPEHVPEPEPPSSVQEYFLAIDHMRDEWKDILKLREALKKNCAEMNKIVDQINYKNENIDFWREIAHAPARTQEHAGAWMLT